MFIGLIDKLIVLEVSIRHHNSEITTSLHLFENLNGLFILPKNYPTNHIMHLHYFNGQFEINNFSNVRCTSVLQRKRKRNAWVGKAPCRVEQVIITD